MARPLRLEYPGAHYHVSARGDRRDLLYRDDADYWRFLATLGEVCQRYGWRGHAYCLLPTRYLLLVETVHANLARGMRQLNGVYSQSYNRRHNVAGHVFSGRYHAHPLHPDQLLEQVCAVLRAPLDAGVTAYVETWRWSSYALMLNPGIQPAWFAGSELLPRVGGLHSNSEGLRQRLQIPRAPRMLPLARMVRHCLPPYTVLSSDFPKRDSAPPLATVVAALADRKSAMRVAYATGHYSLKQIAAHFGVHYATVSRAVGRSAT